VNFVVIGYGITPYLDGFRSVLLLRSVSVAVLLLISVPAGQGLGMAFGSVWGLIAAVGIFDTAAFICSNLGLGTGHVSIVTVLGSLFGAVTVFLGWIFLREHVGKTQWVGVFLIFVGIILVSI
jgi:drug/metabolite transporter (DMT)-like permease